MDEQPTEQYGAIEVRADRDYAAIVEQVAGKATVALIKLSIVLLVIGLEVIVLIAVARLLIK